jgi:hypothetical protein
MAGAGAPIDFTAIAPSPFCAKTGRVRTSTVIARNIVNARKIATKGTFSIVRVLLESIGIASLHRREE